MAKIIIADDHEVVRNGLKLILEQTYDLEIVEGVKSGDELIERIQKESYDLAVLDISMEGKDVFETLVDLKMIKPKMPVVIFSMNPEEQYAIRLLKAGADGYVNKASGVEELKTAIRKALKGEKYISSALSQLLAKNLTLDKPEDPYDILTNREFQVMRMIADGKQLTEIAETLHLSKSTVSNHRSQILKKLNLKNNADISRYAVRNGIV